MGSHYPQLSSDGAGGAIITWQDYRSGDYDIYARRVDASGTPQWGDNGVAICTAGNTQSYPQIISDGSAGAIITWQDYRNGNDDIYARRVDASGTPLWAADGVAICMAGHGQFNPQIISDGSGGAIIAWEDYFDIHAQRVDTAALRSGCGGEWRSAPQRTISLIPDLSPTAQRERSSRGRTLEAGSIKFMHCGQRMPVLTHMRC